MEDGYPKKLLLYQTLRHYPVGSASGSIGWQSGSGASETLTKFFFTIIAKARRDSDSAGPGQYC